MSSAHRSRNGRTSKLLLRPNSAYGISKAAGLQCCQLYRRQKGIFAATGILFNHESPLRKPSFLSQKIVRGALRARQDPTFKLILGDLEARVDWGYAPDYVDAMFRILQLAEASDFVVASERCTRCVSLRRLLSAPLDWIGAEHVETDARLLNKSFSSSARRFRQAPSRDRMDAHH